MSQGSTLAHISSRAVASRRSAVTGAGVVGRGGGGRRRPHRCSGGVGWQFFEVTLALSTQPCKAWAL